MITLKDINKAIVNQVTEGLVNTKYNTVDFSSTDIKESIIRPSFYVEFDSNKTGKFNASNKERTLTARIYYFPTNADKRNKIEILEIEDLLETIFLDDIKINDNFYIPIRDGISFDVIDGVLIATLEDLYTIEELDDTDMSPLMDTLNINLK